ncbi:hypothetical protein NLI96_g44 [Meripilus lineatus]|uniref:Uncharacterized protein n=1 Tax=Meripilus lineatus TaxID=2056292 RepID=A0AAD5VD51_9APHY|nr:hypothetical protein NLI96_g44 [Physisporinus lineatus]
MPFGLHGSVWYVLLSGTRSVINSRALSSKGSNILHYHGSVITANSNSNPQDQGSLSLVSGQPGTTSQVPATTDIRDPIGGRRLYFVFESVS